MRRLGKIEKVADTREWNVRAGEKRDKEIRALRVVLSDRTRGRQRNSECILSNRRTA